MNPLQKTMFSTAVLAAVAIGAPGAARADTFAQSILVIDNFRLQHANGTPYTARDFATLSGGAAAYAGAFLNGAADSELQAGAGNIDLLHRGVGDLPARPENHFAPLPGVAGNFGYADQHMSGAMITSTSGPAGALMQTRADAALAGAGTATGYAGIGRTASFSFSLGVGEYMTIAFDALPFTQAYAGAGAAGSASANLSWTISVTDLNTGAIVFAFAPEQLNALSNVGRSDALAGATTYQPGWLTFAATTSMLDIGDIYQVSIGQGSFASALQAQSVAEPATLAGLGAGLLAMAALGRRRRR